jgi:hypothetical protein
MSLRFEDRAEAINKMIEAKRSNWRLSSITWFDFDDVKQLLLIHVHKKWSQWDQLKPIEPWLSRLIANQMKNMLRDYYYVHARPCLKCAANGGGDSCLLYEIQCKDCPLYKHWDKTKGQKHELNMAQSIFSDNPDEPYLKSIVEVSHIDYPKVLKSLSEKIKRDMSKEAYYVFIMIYIENISEAEVGRKRKYKRDKNATSPKFKQIETFKKKYKEKLKELLDEGGIF